MAARTLDGCASERAGHRDRSQLVHLYQYDGSHSDQRSESATERDIERLRAFLGEGPERATDSLGLAVAAILGLTGLRPSPTRRVSQGRSLR
jgi:hypothetical protein